jgi:hypothetical protein
MALAFAREVEAGYASFDHPPCFDSLDEWKVYVVACALNRQDSKAETHRAINFCRDCTHEYKQRMCEQQRCTHPETVFVMEARATDKVGIPLLDPKKPSQWEQAMMGMCGQITAMPDPAAIKAAMSAIEQANSVAKPRGRPPKKDEEND